MTLVEAFRSVGCLIGDETVDRVRRDAAAMILPELHRLARRTARGLRIPEHLADDAAHEAFCNLMTGGNRSNAALACDSDLRVRAFLKKCLRNAMFDERRRGRPRYLAPGGLSNAIEDAAQNESPEDLAIAAQEIERRESAQREFYERIVPELAANLRPPAGRDLTQAVEHMRALAAGEVEFQKVVIEATGKDDAAAHSAVHQRHSRARRRLVEYIEALAADGHLTPARTEDLRWCVSQLHRRTSS